MVEGLVKLIKSFLQTPVNIGNPVEITLLELVKNVKHLIPQSSSVVIHNPLPQDDPNNCKPDITKALTAIMNFQWQPRVGLKEGLEKTIQYYKSQKYTDGE